MSTVILPSPAEQDLPYRLVVAKWIGYFALIDLLFLPYFQLVIVPFSLPLLLLSMLVLHVKFKRDVYLTLFHLLSFCVVVSVLVAIFAARTDEYLPENIKRVFQLLSSFVYFFYFRWLASQVPLNVAPIAVGFIAWFAGFALMFYLDPSGTGEIIRAFYGRLVTSEDILSEHLRFAYLFTDPNTAAYFFLVAASVLLLEKRSGLFLSVLIAGMTLLTFFTQSKGALIGLVLMILTTLYPPDRFMKSFISVRRAVVLLVVVAGLSGLLLYIVNALGDSSTIVKMAYERVFDSPDQYTSGGSRFEVWERFSNHFLPLPVGRGYALLVEGNFERPHSDVLRLAYSYGVIALGCAVIFFFSRIRSFAPLIIPALLAFLINSLIDEQKLLGLFLALLAISVSAAERRESSAGVPGVQP